MPAQAQTTGSAIARTQNIPWLIALLLAFIAGVLWSRSTPESLPAALGQTPPLVGARGVYAFTGSLDRSSFGLFMLDIEQGTIWCYEIDNVGGVRKLRLIAGRTWVYDRYLRDFNCATPSYRQVQELVALQRESASADETATDNDERGSPQESESLSEVE